MPQTSYRLPNFNCGDVVRVTSEILNPNRLDRYPEDVLKEIVGLSGFIKGFFPTIGDEITTYYYDINFIKLNKHNKKLSPSTRWTDECCLKVEEHYYNEEVLEHVNYLPEFQPGEIVIMTNDTSLQDWKRGRFISYDSVSKKFICAPFKSKMFFPFKFCMKLHGNEYLTK